MGNWHDDVFFGLHFDLHANREDKDLGAGLTVERLAAELEKVGPDWVQCDCKGHPGLTSYPTKAGWTAPGLVKDAIRIWRDATRMLGIPLAMHYSGLYDLEAVDAHPDWCRGKADGKPERHAICPRAPYTQELMIPQLLELIDGYDVDGFWIDGETVFTDICWCDRCKQAFAAKTGRAEPPRGHDEPGWAEWMDFQRDNVMAHLRACEEAVHARKPSCTVAVSGAYGPVQPEAFVSAADYLSMDMPCLGVDNICLTALSRTFAPKGRSWDSLLWGFCDLLFNRSRILTTKTRPALRQEAALVMAGGGAPAVVSQPDRTGMPIDWCMDELADLATFVRERESWCRGTSHVPQAALLNSRDAYYGAIDSLYVNYRSNFLAAFDGALHCLLEAGVPADLLCDDQLMEDLGKYPLVVIPNRARPRPELVDALSCYVKGGGRLLLAGADTAGTFADLLGIEADPGEVATCDHYLKAIGGTVLLAGAWRHVRPPADSAALPLYDGRDVGARARPSPFPSAFVRRVGKGAVATIPGPIFEGYLSHYDIPRVRAFVREVVDRLAAPGLVRADAPSSIQLSLRARGDELFVHLVNAGGLRAMPHKKDYAEDVPPAGPVRVRIPLGKAPRAVRLEPGARPAAWSYADGTLAIDVPAVGIHDIVAVDRTMT